MILFSKPSNLSLSILFSLGLITLSTSGCGLQQTREQLAKEQNQQQTQESTDKENSEKLKKSGSEASQTENDSDSKNTEEKDALAIVNVQPVRFVNIPQTMTFTGRTAAFETLQVHPQATGTVKEIHFKQGHWIRSGKPLYNIDPKDAKNAIKTSEAAIKQAKAGLKSAKSAHKRAKANLKTQEALLATARDDYKRYKSLIADGAVSEQVYEQSANEVKTAKAAIKSTKALIEQTAADIKTAKADIELAEDRLNSGKTSLKNTLVKAPLTGFIVDSNIVKGKKVDLEQKDAYITIATVNPIFVNIHPTANEMMELQAAFKQSKKTKKQKSQPSLNKIKLILENGEEYASTGAFKFTETKIDENSQITMKALFDNPLGSLLPNMKVKAQLQMPTLTKQVLLPPTAIMNSIIANPNADEQSNTDQQDTLKIESKDKTDKPQSIQVKKESSNIKKETPDTKKENANSNQPKTSSKQSDVAKPVVSDRQEKTGNDPKTDAEVSTSKLGKIKQAVANFVYVVDENNQVQPRAVQVTGNYQDKLIINSGLKEGDKVIINSNKVIYPKQIVTIDNQEHQIKKQMGKSTANTTNIKRLASQTSGQKQASPTSSTKSQTVSGSKTSVNKPKQDDDSHSNKPKSSEDKTQQTKSHKGTDTKAHSITKHEAGNKSGNVKLVDAKSTQ